MPNLYKIFRYQLSSSQFLLIIINFYFNDQLVTSLWIAQAWLLKKALISIRSITRGEWNSCHFPLIEAVAQ